MAIKTYTTGDRLAAGQWVCCESVMPGSFAGRPGQILQIKDSSIVMTVYYSNVLVNLSDIEKRVKRLTSIRWVCDTQVEAMQMFESSERFVRLQAEKESKFKMQLKRDRQALIDSHLAKSVVMA